MNDMEPEPSLDVVKPDTLTPKASEKWDQIVKVLQDCKVMTTADEDVLAKYCEAWVMWREATDAVVKESVVYGEDGIPKLNPMHRIQDQYFKQMMAGARELGLTPAARTKVKTTEKKKSDSGFSSV
jgi:P27 family predicted phage terminase small subunit